MGDTNTAPGQSQGNINSDPTESKYKLIYPELHRKEARYLLIISVARNIWEITKEGATSSSIIEQINRNIPEHSHFFNEEEVQDALEVYCVCSGSGRGTLTYSDGRPPIICFVVS